MKNPSLKSVQPAVEIESEIESQTDADEEHFEEVFRMMRVAASVAKKLFGGPQTPAVIFGVYKRMEGDAATDEMASVGLRMANGASKTWFGAPSTTPETVFQAYDIIYRNGEGPK
jgi:hypothetical protein